MIIPVALRTSVPSSCLESLRAMLAYCDPRIETVDVTAATEGTVVVSLKEPANPDEVTAKVRRVADRVARDGPVPPSRILHRVHTPANPTWVRHLEDELTERGWTVRIGDGLFALLGPAATLARLFDEQFRAIAMSLGAQETQFPTLLDVEFLNRIGYFRSFPHYVTLAAHLRPDIDDIDAFMAVMKNKPPAVPLNGQVEPARAILSPTICYHLYHALADRAVPRTGFTVTAVGNCCRWESTNMAHLRRLWEFRMRELIIVGTKDRVLEVKDRALKATLELCRNIGLAGWLENANDPFFSDDGASKGAYQRGFGMKWELRLPYTEDGDSVAAASFNNVQRTLTDASGITLDDGEPAFSGCIGWGLERWVYVFFAQRGLDPAKWPAFVHPVAGQDETDVAASVG